jgi:hypothetical protein
LLLALGALPAAQVFAQRESYSPDSVKAAFLYHFAGYVEWPPESLQKDALVIGVIGAPVIAAELRRILPGRTIQSLPLKVRELDGPEDLVNVDIVYVGRQHSNLLSRLDKQQRLLVVSDVDDGLDRGAVINFVEREQRIRFEISLRMAERMGLKLSSRLLAAALRVRRTQWYGPTFIAGGFCLPRA